MDLTDAPAALAAAGARVAALETTLPNLAAKAILAAANPPRATGALDATGRVEAGLVLYGGGVVDYAAPAHKLNPWLDRAADTAPVVDLAADELAQAITL